MYLPSRNSVCAGKAQLRLESQRRSDKSTEPTTPEQQYIVARGRSYLGKTAPAPAGSTTVEPRRAMVSLTLFR